MERPANNAEKLYTGTEKDGIGKFLYRLRPEVPYAHLSSQLAAIFYHSEVWEWNEQKIGMKFLLLPGNWQERTMRYYRSSLDPETETWLLIAFICSHRRQATAVLKTWEINSCKLYFDYF
ncbi:hypothetical protein [Methanosarcina lacustris]|uniref:hypothetical protein n=1 Tax=Methanosarcina lacustris TaxID=170861 RepID=UPI000B239BEC|nr:hypothetical protein [Methanosarcina lacustris]